MTVPGPRPGLSLVVPVFDEAERLQEFAGTLLDFVRSRLGGAELVLVDDGSTDTTAEDIEAILRDAAPATARLLRRPHAGKGAAVAAGISECRGVVVAFCDLDLSTPLDQLELVIGAAERAPVLAIGSRDVSGAVLVRPEGWVREALGRTYNRLLQATVVPGVVDTQCGAKAAAADVWAALLPHCRQEGFAWDAELCAVALAVQVELQEVPIAWSHDDRSRVRVLRDGIAMVRQTPQLWASVRRARALAPAPLAPVAAERADEPREIFDTVNAARMQAVDRTHWWFRSKAAFVSTALRRTAAGPPAGWLIDAGGGSGGVSAILGWPTAGVLVVEGNTALVATARRRHGLAALQGSVHELPVAAGHAAVVCLLDVIEHLRDPQPALRDARRALGPGGRLVVNVPAHRWLWSRADEELGHQRRYTRRSLRRDLAAAGFEPVLVTHVFSWLVPPVWFVRRFARSGGAELGLDRRSPLIDLASLVLTALERQLIGRVGVPFGTSVMAVARVAPLEGDADQPIQ